MSATAARKLDHPPGRFTAYRPDLLLKSGFVPPASWDGLARSAEAAIWQLETEHGQLASSIGWVLQRSESLGSSTIEDVNPSLRRVARAEAIVRDGGDPFDDAAREAIGNIAATRLAAEVGNKSGPVSMDDLLLLHNELMLHTRQPQIGGRLRQGWVHIGGVLGGYPPPAYVAPPAEDVPVLLDDLIDYINTSDHHPVIAAAVAHAQFELIHPFGDGNGRTGRALVQTILRKGGVTEHSVPPISALLALNRDAYTSALGATAFDGSGNPAQRVRSLDQWITLFLTTAEESCGHARKLIDQIEAITEGWESIVKARKKSAVRGVMECLPALPVFSVREIAVESGTSLPAAYRAVNRLEAAGIITSVRGKHKGRWLYEASAVLDIFKDDTPQNDLSLEARSIDADGIASPAKLADLPTISPSTGHKPEKKDQRSEAIHLRRLGYTHKQIGDALGLSTSWAQKATKGVPRGRRG